MNTAASHHDHGDPPPAIDISAYTTRYEPVARKGQRRRTQAQQAAAALAEALHPGERAALLVASAFYQAFAPANGPLLPTTELIERLRASLPLPLRRRTEEALAALATPLPPRTEAMPWEPDEAASGRTQVASAVATAAEPLAAPAVQTQIQQAIARNTTITMRYTDANGVTTERTIRPILLRSFGDRCYCEAFCLRDNAERTFRLDRIAAIIEPNPTTSHALALAAD